MRWLVDVTSLGKGDKQSLVVEAESWQKALQSARSQRGETAPMSGFSIELLDDGCRAVDPMSRLRYEVKKAPDEAGHKSQPPRSTSQPAKSGSQPPKSASNQPKASSQSAVPASKRAPPAAARTMAMGSGPAAVVQPTPAPSHALPPTPAPISAHHPVVARADVAAQLASQVIFKREQDATDAVPLTYREAIYLVAPGTSEAAAETLLLTQLEMIRASLDRAPAGKLVQLGVYDLAFVGKPTYPPLVTLTWKDWRDAPVVTFPRRPKPAPAPTPAADAPIVATPIVAVVQTPVPPAGPVSVASTVPGRFPPPGALPSQAVAPASVHAPEPAPAPVSGHPPAPVSSHAPAPVSSHAPAPVFGHAPASSHAPAPLHAPAHEAVSAHPPAPAPTLPPPPAPEPVLPPPPSAVAPVHVAPLAPVAAPGPQPASVPRVRVRGEDLLADLFEAMHELHFVRDALEGGEFCLTLAMEKLPCHAGIVHLYDIARREFFISSTRGAGTGKLLLRRHPEADPLLHEALRAKRAVVVVDAAAGEASGLARYGMLGGARSLLISPVLLHGRVLGAIELVNPLDGQPFNEPEGNALTYIAEQFADFISSHGIVTDAERINQRRVQDA